MLAGQKGPRGNEQLHAAPRAGLLSSEMRDQSGIQNSISQGARAISQGFAGKASRRAGMVGGGR